MVALKKAHPHFGRDLVRHQAVQFDRPHTVLDVHPLQGPALGHGDHHPALHAAILIGLQASRGAPDGEFLVFQCMVEQIVLPVSILPRALQCQPPVRPGAHRHITHGDLDIQPDEALRRPGVGRVLAGLLALLTGLGLRPQGGRIGWRVVGQRTGCGSAGVIGLVQKLGVEHRQGGKGPRQHQHHRRGDARHPLPTVQMALWRGFLRSTGETALPGDLSGQVLRRAQLLHELRLPLWPGLFKVFLVVAQSLRPLPVRDQGGQSFAKGLQILPTSHHSSPPSKVSSPRCPGTSATPAGPRPTAPFRRG